MPEPLRCPNCRQTIDPASPHTCKPEDVARVMASIAASDHDCPGVHEPYFLNFVRNVVLPIPID